MILLENAKHKTASNIQTIATTTTLSRELRLRPKKTLAAIKTSSTKDLDRRHSISISSLKRSKKIFTAYAFHKDYKGKKALQLTTIVFSPQYVEIENQWQRLLRL